MRLCALLMCIATKPDTWPGSLKAFKKWSNCPLPNYPPCLFSSFCSHSWDYPKLIAFCPKVRSIRLMRRGPRDLQGLCMEIKCPNIGDGEKVQTWHMKMIFVKLVLLGKSKCTSVCRFVDLHIHYVQIRPSFTIYVLYWGQSYTVKRFFIRMSVWWNVEI